MSLISPVPPTSSLEGAVEQELKFHVPFSHQAQLALWLRMSLKPHEEFPRSMICSVYFDTPSLRHLEEKKGSDFAKTKHRIRWYATPDGRPLPGPAWLETKRKGGNTRTKSRKVLPVSGGEASRLPLWDRRWQEWAAGFSPEASPQSAGALRPLVEVRYQRERFSHPLYAGATFCLDTEIHCPRAHPGGGFVHSTARLTDGVFEQKSLSFEVLPPARALPRFNVRRSSFSKYERLALTLLDDPDLTP